ncbi:MAG: hypothetical protein A2281_11185 [Bacteroidetes bacterium RIFOXYA12_FULL_38_20]|nr:MAG: hypothetical protein A2281_11185 [Bacteroidetes bacterium RIFOXYA12_FULL_38_20]
MSGLNAQRNNTLYFMESIPQSNLLNPAIQHECKWNIGGLITPILPPVELDFGLNGFAIKELVPIDKSLDSIIHPEHPLFDYDKYYKRLRKMNYITADVNINLLSAGYKWKDDWYFTFNLSEKIFSRTGISKNLLTFIDEGNGKSLMNKDVELAGVLVDVVHYREYAIGASKKLDDKLIVGGKVKFLFGKANIYTRHNDLLMKTFDDPTSNFETVFTTDIEYNMSQPFFSIDTIRYDNENDSVILVDTTYEIEPMDYVMNNKNFGLALDLGATYKLNAKTTLYASILDIGWITFKDNVSTIRSKGQFMFDGVDVVPYLEETDSAYVADLTDSVVDIFFPTLDKGKYKYYLAPKIYLGGNYEINDKFSVQGLYRVELYRSTPMMGLTLSGQANLKKWVSLSLSYAVTNNTFKNLGLGIMLKAWRMQFYFVGDNLLGTWQIIRQDGEFSGVMPYTMRYVSFRFGMNLIFGCPKASQSMFGS